MKRYTLIVDGNYFLHKTFFISGRIKGNKGALNFVDDPEKDADILINKLATDFAYEVRRFAPVLDGIVYCIDSSSWRKDFYPESNESPNAVSKEYKGQRKRDNTINWKAIYDLHDKFAESLKKLGCTISRVGGAEADDLIFAWSAYLNMNEKNSLIFSGDNDLIQLVCNNESNDTNTVYYNKFSKRLYSPLGFSEWLSQTTTETIDIFDQPLDLTSNTKIGLQGVLRGVEIAEVDTLEFVFKKILTGDSGDNVSPLHQFVKKLKTGKTRVYGITDKKATMILEKFTSKNGDLTESTFFNQKTINEICQITRDTLGIHNETLPELVEKYEANRNLMYLHNRALPAAIMDVMLKSIEDAKHTTIHAIDQINKTNISTPILNNEKNITTTNEASFFGGIKFD